MRRTQWFIGDESGRSWLRLPILTAIVASISWCAIRLLILFSGSNPATSPSILDTIILFLMPLLLIWAFALIFHFKMNLEHRQHSLHDQIQSLQDQLVRVEKLERSPENDADPADQDEEFQEEPQHPQPKDVELRPSGGEEKEEEESSERDIQTLHVPVDTLVRAVNFAEDEDDTETLDALERVAGDREIDKLLGLAIQILQLLVEDDIEVDLLPAEFAPPNEWRNAFGERANGTATDGPDIRFLGNVGTPTHHATVEKALARDPGGRALAERFIASALGLTARLIREASDRQIQAYANTRTIRAWILVLCAQARD
ncbi:MAG: hypothetical protein OXD33_01460 [Rhodobacteraceae bacterium]|nr:hypothetical protein [Paracoccaceae bacterium]